MKWLWGGVAALAALLGVAVAVPFFVSLDDYVPRIEKAASAHLKEPVKIGKIRLSMLPLPHVTIEAIAVGRGSDLTVGEVTVTPDLLSLLNATKVVRSIEIDGLVLTQKAIEKIPAWAKPDAASSAPPPVRIAEVRVGNATVKFGAATFGPFDARARLDDRGSPAEVSLATRDGKLKALVRPQQAGYAIAANARDWKMPVGPPVVFERLDVEGVATPTEATFSRIDAKLFGGSAVGKASLGWQAGLKLQGTLGIRQVELATLVPLLSPGTRIGGKLDAKPVFSAAARDAAGLMPALRLSTPFEVRSGVLHGFDLHKAAATLGKQGTAEGETRFDQLSGQLALENSAYRVTRLKVSAGAFGAEGTVGISAAKALSGRVDTRVMALGTSATVPLNVAGTLQSPIVLPTAGTVAGAAIGTAILPGIGTGVGAKAGQVIEGLFGRK